MKWTPPLDFIVILVVIAIAVIIALDMDSPAQGTEVPTNLYTKPIIFVPSAKNQRLAEGRALFKSNCASCHNPVSDGTGPALMGATLRWKEAGNFKGKTGVQWMRIWIKDWHEAVNAGYQYAINMHKSRPGEMNVFGDLLHDVDIDNIMFYVDSGSIVFDPPIAY